MLLVIDNDDPASDSGVAAAEGKGAEVVRWQQGHSLEDEIVGSLSLQGLAALVELAADIKGEKSVLDGIKARLVGSPELSGLHPASWITTTCTVDSIRQAMGAAAKGKKVKEDAKEEKNAWFKQEASGEQLGTMLIEYWAEIADTPLGLALKSLYTFAYGEKLS